MANKVAYNNIQYDILDAIQMGSREYLIMLNPDNFYDIRYIEKANINGVERYFLPPTDFSLEKNNNADLKRLEIHTIINKLVDIIKGEVVKENLNTVADINKKINEIKSFCSTDLTLKSFVEDTSNLNIETFNKIATYLTKYLEHNLATKKVQKTNNEEIGLNRPIKTIDGLNYDWLYDLSSKELKEIASDKNRTSEELIYILDALDKRIKTEQSIEGYVESGHSKVHKQQNKAAFIDILLLSCITGSFGILLLLSIFN